MSIFSRLRSPIGPARGVSYGTSQTGILGTAMGRRSSLTRQQALTDAYRGWAATAIDKNALRVSEFPIYGLRCSQDEKGKIVRRRDEKHGFTQLMWRPNQFMPGTQLLMDATINAYLCGEAFWYIERFGDGRPAELWPLRPDRMKEVPHEEFFQLGWLYTPPGAMKPDFMRIEDVVHIVYFRDPLNPYRGRSPISKQAIEVDTDRAIAVYGRSTVETGGRLDLLMQTQAENEDALKRLQAGLTERYNEARKGGRILTLGKAITQVTPTNLNPKDLEYLALAEYTQEALLAALGSNKSVLGITDDANRASSQTAYGAWNRDTIRTILRFTAEAAGHRLLPQFGDPAGQMGSAGHWYEAGFDDPVPEDVKAKAEADEIYIRAGAKSVNEVRAELGKESLVGFDEPWVESTKLPASLAIAQAQTDLEVLQDTGRSMRAVAAARKLKALPAPRDAEGFEEGPEEDEFARHWRGWVRSLQGPAERRFLKVHNAVARQQEREVLANLEEHGPRLISEYAERYSESVRREIMERKKGDKISTIMFDERRWFRLFGQKAHPVLEEAVKKSGQKTFGDVDLDIAFDVKRPEVAKWVKKQAFEHYAEEVNKTTAQKLRKTLADGLADGENIESLRKRIQHVYKGLNTSRARMAARTETAAALNYGDFAAYEEATELGLELDREWVAALDGRTRDSHRSANGTKAGSDGKFTVGTHKCDHPGDPSLPAEEVIHCRCTSRTRRRKNPE